MTLERSELEEEAAAIQVEMDGIHSAQDAVRDLQAIWLQVATCNSTVILMLRPLLLCQRARQIAARLQSAGASILAFGDANGAGEVEAIDDDDGVYDK